MPNLWKFLSIFLVFSNVNANNCTIEMPRDAPQPTPIILTRDGLFRPTSDVTTIREFDSITLLCTGRNNTVLALNKEIVPLECRNGKFLFMGRPFALKDMKCKSVPTSQLWQNGTSCAAGNGVFYEVGVSSKTTWHPIFKICFNQRDQRTVYSRNMINGYMQNVRAKRNCRPSSFKREANYCIIRMPEDVPQPTPVIVTSTGFFRPINAVTIIQDHDTITLFCTERNNKVLALNEAIVTLVCRNGDFLYMGRTHALKDVKCDTVPTSQLWQNGTICAAGKGVFYEVGFSLGRNWHPIFKICFNQHDQRTIYSRNLINGFVRNYKSKKECRPSSFKSDGVRYNADSLYRKKSQRTHFEALFGANQNFVNDTSFLARGHIAPVADFIFCYEQFATFYYANAAPEWQAVNGGNWKRVENAVRKIASLLPFDLLVFTGTLDVLQLQNPLTSRNTKIYLDENQTIAVPKWFYKVVMHPNFEYDIVFITLNNPFATNVVGVEFCNNICSQICNKFKLDCSTFTDTITGYTFCCELKDFWANAAMHVRTPYYELPDGWSYKN